MHGFGSCVGSVIHRTAPELFSLSIDDRSANRMPMCEHVEKRPIDARGADLLTHCADFSPQDHLVTSRKRPTRLEVFFIAATTRCNNAWSNHCSGYSPTLTTTSSRERSTKTRCLYLPSRYTASR